MTENYKPRILVQGAVLVSPDGSVHSPMHTDLKGPEDLLSFNHWELTREGLETAIDYAKKHRLNDDYYNKVQENIDRHSTAYQMLQEVIAQQQKGEMADLPDMAKMIEKNTWREAANFLFQWQMDNHYGIGLNASPTMTALKNAVLKRDPKSDLTQHVLDWFGFTKDNETAVALAEEYARNSFDQRRHTIGALINLRLEDISAHPDIFLADVKKHKASVTAGKSKQLLQHGADKIQGMIHSETAAKTQMIATGGGALAFIGGASIGILNAAIYMSSNATAPYDPVLAELGIGLGVGGSTAVAAALTSDVLVDKMAHACRVRTGCTPELSEKKGKALIAGMEQDINALPEKTKRLIEHFDPLIFVASNIAYHSGTHARQARGGSVISSPINVDGQANTAANSIFVQRKKIGRHQHTVFEEARHLIHSKLPHKWDSDQKVEIAMAFLKDIKSDQGVDFVNRWGVKPNFWENPAYEGSDLRIGEEALVECDHIVRSLMKSGRSEKAAINELARYLPNTRAHHQKMLEAENVLLDHIGASSLVAPVATSEERDITIRKKGDSSISL